MKVQYHPQGKRMIEVYPNGKIKSAAEHNLNGQLKSKMEYDSNGYRVLEKKYDSDGKKLLEIAYRYDNVLDGWLPSVKMYDDKGKVKSQIEHYCDGTVVESVYDDAGRCQQTMHKFAFSRNILASISVSDLMKSTRLSHQDSTMLFYTLTTQHQR